MFVNKLGIYAVKYHYVIWGIYWIHVYMSESPVLCWWWDILTFTEGDITHQNRNLW